ncbi:MAG: molybdopterin-dependent oxidoreductase [Deltaproteobacteria bacterium]|nr:molybdopterin-dependent oxidoreductase [Deltaproteobacteria bacterium]
MKENVTGYHVVGKSVTRLDAVEKVTGHGEYIPDLHRPNMLHGAMLRSPIPHGRILDVDTARAKRLPGVKAVITGRDIPDTFLGFQIAQANKRPLCLDKVRYVGDEIAAVAAESEETAREACSLIRVQFEPLPAVFDPESSLEPEAPLVHEDKPRNISGEVHKVFGDVEEGFARAFRVFESTFRTTGVAHCCMETRGALAEFDMQGRVTLWSTTQFPHVLRDIMSRVLDMPVGKIRVRKAFIGGGFGSRQSMDSVDPVCVLLAQKTGRPVRIVKTRPEELVSDRIRYPMIIKLKTGVKETGELLARKVEILTDGGAYNDQGLAVTTSAGSKITGLYRVPNVEIDGMVVFTNKVWGGAFRGYGNPQITFAIESQMDEIAEELGMGKLELRLLNANRQGDVTVAGARYVSCGFTECLEKSTAAAGWKDGEKTKPEVGKGPKLRGMGMAGMIHTGGGGISAHGGNFSSAFIKVEEDGSVDLLTGVPDVGQGSDTVLAQIAAEEIGVSMEAMRIHAGDTAITPSTQGVRGSRETFVAGNAVRIAARKAKDELLKRGSSMLGVGKEELEVADGRIYVRSNPGRYVTVAQAAALPMFDRASAFPMGVPVVASSCYVDPVSKPSDRETGYGNICPTWVFGAQVAEVEVDRETGQVTVIRVIAAHDVGKAINPCAVEGQFEGAIVQGIGMALSERIIWQDGAVANRYLGDYKLPTTMDTPGIETILVETNDPYGPFGAKGVGEAAIVPTAAAIANAVYDATGVRIRELPITAEKVLAALKQKGG